MVAIGVGLVLASLLFLKRMADVTEAHNWIDITDDEDTDPDNISLKKIPENTRVYEINGPMFFAASEKFEYMLDDTDTDILVIHGAPTAFPDEVLKEARKISEGGVQEYNFNNREDLRDMTIFTIDSAESKDLDDAVSL